MNGKFIKWLDSRPMDFWSVALILGFWGSFFVILVMAEILALYFEPWWALSFLIVAVVAYIRKRKEYEESEQ